MLKIYDDMLDVIRLLKPIVKTIEKHDDNLADQLKRSATSAFSNIGEGSGCRSGRRRQHYEIALGSAREAMAQVDCAEAWGHIDNIPVEVKLKLRKVINVLVANVHRH